VIVVDSSVWIDFLNGRETDQVRLLKKILGVQQVGMPDLVLTEILQGTKSEWDFNRVLRILRSMTPIETGGQDVAIEAARNYRRLRGMGITVRKTIDTLIATRCIIDGHELLYSDRDFDPFVEHLGLGVVATH
jgi:predicted nucleic acid-binding protein